MLEPASDRPINLNFPTPKPIKQIYRALADAAGINVIFDPQLKDDNVAIVLTNIEFQKALETLCARRTTSTRSSTSTRS